MSDLKFVALISVILKIAYCVCITVAAIHFNRVGILWWYWLALLFGYEYRGGKDDKNE